MTKYVLPFKRIVHVHVQKFHVKSIVLDVLIMAPMNVVFAHVPKDTMDENVNVIQHHQQWNPKFNNAKSTSEEKPCLSKVWMRIFSRPGSLDICSGRGQCVCGRCKCETATIEVSAGGWGDGILDFSSLRSAGSTYLRWLLRMWWFFMSKKKWSRLFG